MATPRGEPKWKPEDSIPSLGAGTTREPSLRPRTNETWEKTSDSVPQEPSHPWHETPSNREEHH